MKKIGIGLGAGYVPIFRMERDTIAKNWGRSSLGGERTLANNDEDSLTLAVEAGRNALKGRPREDIDGLFFASTTAPYQEKLNAAVIAAAMDLRREITTVDFAHSLRAGTGALKAAIDAVANGSMQNVLVTAADCRMGYPRSDQEQLFGDGGAALLVSGEDVAATWEGSYSLCNEMHDVWRNAGELYVRTGESRFILQEGYTRHMQEVITGILKKYGLEAKEISKAVIPAPDPRTHMGLVQKLGLDPKTQVVDPLLTRVGFSGAAHPLLMLAGALEESRPGDILLLAAYADGADALLFKVTEAVLEWKKNKTLTYLLDQKLIFPSYARFLSYKGIVETVPGEPFRLFPSATATWRDQRSILRCHGSRCLACGQAAFPIQRVCNQCRAKDHFEEIPLSDLRGEVFTFTLDNLAGRSDDPVVVQTIAEFGADKIRFYGMMTDCLPTEVTLGMPVELTFRRIYDGAGMPNYFWKCKPVRMGGTQ